MHIRLITIAALTVPVLGGIAIGVIVAAIFFNASDHTPTQITFAPPPPDHVSSEPVVTSANFRLCVEGDNNLATMDDIIDDNEDLYSYVQPKLAKCDLVMANLESNISTPGTGTIQPKGYNYNATLNSVRALARGHVNLVTLANNHTMDFGAPALVDEMKHLHDGGIAYFGAGANITEAFTPKYYMSHGTTIAFIGANDIENWITDAKADSAGSAYFDETLLTNEISQAKKEADIVLIYLHWGEENSDVVNSRQVYFAQKFIDAGADIVVGTGPHIRQMHTTYKDKPVYYSLGNFAVRGFFGWPDRSKGDLLNIDIQDKKIAATSTTEVTIDYAGIPDGPYN